MKAGIVGAGLIGRLLAFQLLKLGWKVTLFDQDTFPGERSCSYAAAGMLSPYAETESAEYIIYKLGKYSLTRWPEIINSLNREIYFKQNGSILIAHTRDQNALGQYVNHIVHETQDNTAIQLLTLQTLNELEPDLPWRGKAYYLPAEGHLHCLQLLAALHDTLLTKGAEWHWQQCVTEIKPFTISIREKQFQFDWVFDCRGLGAKSIFPNLRGVRGEAIWLHAPDVNITRPLRLIHPRYQMYVVPRGEQHYVIGASEIESEDFSAISVRTTLELLSAAYTLHPAFAEANILKTVVNCRPALPNNQPSIKYADGYTAINGLYRHGYLTAPALVDEVITLLEKQPTPSYATEIIKTIADCMNLGNHTHKP